MLQIHIKHKNDKGDILVFLPGQNEIETAVETINRIKSKFEEDNLKLKVFPLYSNLVYEKQLSVFEPLKEGFRKVVIATNIAETSVTISGIRFVIDSGLVKEKVNKSLVTKKCSKISCMQRRGRAGRDVENGVVLRLFREDDYLDNFEFTDKPSILREDLDGLVLNLKAMGIPNVVELSWIDKPAREKWKSALVNLRKLKAIDHNNDITDLGAKMAKIPLEPEISRLLISS